MQIPIDKYREISAAIWQYFKRHSDVPEDDDDWWKELISALDDIVEPYRDTIFFNYAIEYGVLCINTLHRHWKQAYGEV